ncbi:MAG: Rrf2 family transcriptional regulator [Lachnospiraceae bacterium]|nr:Rrf2 family transcriptional regulator [Lachnospiraceae bacterium]
MLVSTRGRYALRVVIDLANQNSGAYIPLKDIADRQEISEKYLESIVKLLTKAGLLEGLRGKGGGYKLTKPAEEYTVYSILELTEDGLAPVSCLECSGKACPRAAECPTLSLWKGLDDTIREYLTNITVADLLHDGQGGNEYVI